jgi:Rieske Fe-S protein
MSEPCWKRAFPVSWADDHTLARREFTRSLAWISGACFVSSAALTAAASLVPTADPPPPLRVASVDDLPLGGCQVFVYPEGGGPCLLIRTGAESFAAFSQSCTHLGCPVHYQPEESRLSCPCHEGFFAASDGRVLGGPPPRPLPRILLERRGDELWAVGVLR